MVSAIRLFGGTSSDRARALEQIPVTKGVMDTIYPWWWDEREFPRRAVMTEWFYNPLKGQPRYVDIYRLRSLAASEWVFMCTSTIIEEIAQVPWEIVPKDPKLQESPPEQILNEIDEVNYFLNNPNDNKGETINTVFRAMLRDSLELDAGCIVKGFSESSYDRHPAGGFELRPQGERMLLEIFARDGGSFLKETDVNGIEYRLWQYSYLHPAVAPIEFDVNEVVYAMRYPRSYGVYGWSEIQSLETVLNLLINSAFTNATMFQEYAVPSGVVSFTGSKEDEDRLREYFRTEIKGRFHKVAVLNREAKFVPLAYTNRDMEFLKGQEWFAKLVWAIYKLTPTEMGFQDEIRETGKAMAAQGRIQKRKSVFPLLRLIEQVMNNQIINEFSPRVKFQFNFVDKEEEYADTQLEIQELSQAMMTINEWRKKRKIGGPVPWGDQPLAITLAELRGPSGFGGAPSPPKPPSMPSPGQDALRQFTADEKAGIEATKAWGARGNPSYDFEDKADRAAPIYTWDQTGKRIIQVADTTVTPSAFDKQYRRPTRPARGPYAGHGKPPVALPTAMGGRPDETFRAGELGPGQNPEEIQRARDATKDEMALGPMTRIGPHRTGPHDEFRGGMGAHRWERDETGRIAMGTQVSRIARDRLAPPRRVRDPITDVESRIVPTPPIRAGPIKYPRNVPPVEMATAPGGVGPQRESLGFLEAPKRGRFMNKQAPEHTHTTAFRGPVKAELSLARKLTSVLRKFRKGLLSRDQVLLEGRKAIDGNQLRILEIARKRASRVIGKEVLELAPEVTNRLEGIRTQALSDFQRIIDDARELEPTLKMAPPYGTTGGKRREASFLKTLIPEHQLYVEPFAGAASVFFSLEDPPRRAVLNDISGDMMRTINWIKKATPQDVEDLKNRDWFGSKPRFFAMQKWQPKTENDRVYKFLYLKRHSFMQGMKTWRGTKRPSDDNPPAWLEKIDQYRGQLSGTKIENSDYKEILTKYDSPQTFFYIDPPYEEKFARELASILPTLKGHWLLSFSGHRGLRDALASSGFHTAVVPVYNQINKPTGKTRTLRQELIATNYPIRVPKDLVFKEFQRILDDAR